MRLPALAVLLVPLVCAASQSAAAPTGVFHSPPTHARMAEPVPVNVVLEGVPDGDPVVKVYFRPTGWSDYTGQALESRGNGRYGGTIPPTATRGTELKYYIEIFGPDGAYRAGVGSGSHPFSVLLRKPVPSSSIDLRVKTVAGLTLFVVFGGVIALHGRRRKRAVLEKMFWLETLGPVIGLRGRQLAEQLNRMSDSSLFHPVDGTRTYQRDELLRRLGEVRDLDAAALRAQYEHYTDTAPRVATRIEASEDRESEEQIRGRLGAVASGVGRLCAAAWFLSRCRPDGDKLDLGFLEPFTKARQTVRRAQEAIAEGRSDDVRQILRSLDDLSLRLQLLVAEVDAVCSPEELSRALSQKNAVTSDMLGRLVEYYAGVCAESDESRKKLLVTASALVTRDAIGELDPIRFTETLRDRALLRGIKGGSLDAAMLERSSTMPEQLLPISIVRFRKWHRFARHSVRSRIVSSRRFDLLRLHRRIRLRPSLGFRDVDFASETAELTRNQVLQQAGISVLAQANVSTQSALSLLG